MKYLTKIIVVSLLISLSMPPSSVFAGSENWGLGYPDPGEKPTGNTSAEALLENNAYYVGEGDEKVIYLTFDCGYENGHTAKILDVLKETKVPAAFFVVGTYIRDNPELIDRMAKEGHIVGNHTMNHPDMSVISDKAAFEQELALTEDYYLTATGEEIPRYYRPPQGKYSEENLKMASELGYTTVFWSLAYVDWNVDDQPTKEAAFSKLLPRVHPGTVLLLHNTSETNAEILEELICKYKEQGYAFKSLDDLTAKQ